MINEKIKFKTIVEQIEILKTRGMKFNDYEKAHLYLLSNNYFNIINGYSKYFQQVRTDTNNDTYLENTSFDEVCNLYFFDKEIKKTLLDAILHAEHHLKSIFAHRFAEAFPNKKYAYLDIESYAADRRIDGLKCISRLSKLIENKIKYKDEIITHYVKKYDDIPIWVLVDSLDFGTINFIIKSLSISIQNKIALDLTSFFRDNSELMSPKNAIQVWPPETMNSFVKNITETRNICAHNNRLLSFNCKSDSQYYSTLHDFYSIKRHDKRRSPFSTIVSLQCFLSTTEYSVLYNSIRKQARNLSKKLTTISIEDVMSELGFPENWISKPKRKQ